MMEWIKLSNDVNLRKCNVLRQQKNTDREFRYEEDYVKNPINVDVARHLFYKVRKHLTTGWSGGYQGWLAD
jgi:hypothetical protein